MIKFIDFREVWFQPELVARVVAIVGRSPLSHASALIQRDFGCVLGVHQTKKLPHVAKVDLVWQLGGVIWVNRGATMDHMFSIGEESGERAGTGSNSIC
ncbi:hypothetical protein TNCV_5071851 [Trichonephila clavipes]|nr:hypothetical protein TNCV_5071851 [Trichonephila clavipes]